MAASGLLKAGLKAQERVERDVERLERERADGSKKEKKRPSSSASKKSFTVSSTAAVLPGSSSTSAVPAAPVAPRASSHVIANQLKVVQFLHERFLKEKDKKQASVKEIKKHINVDVMESELLTSLRLNPKIECHPSKDAPTHLEFKPQHAVMNRDEIVSLVDTTKTGISVDNLKESYEGILDDVEALVRGRRVIRLNNMDTKPPIAFLYPIGRDWCIYVDPDIQELWQDAHESMPREQELDKALDKAKLPKMHIIERERSHKRKGDDKGKTRKRARKTPAAGAGNSNSSLTVSASNPYADQ